MCVIRSTSTRDRTKISSQVTFKKRIYILYDIQKKERKEMDQNGVRVTLTEPLHSSPIAVWMILVLLSFTASSNLSIAWPHDFFWKFTQHVIHSYNLSFILLACEWKKKTNNIQLWKLGRCISAAKTNLLTFFLVTRKIQIKYNNLGYSYLIKIHVVAFKIKKI